MIDEKSLDKLREIIYQSLMSIEDMGLGEMADAKDEADRIVNEWLKTL